MVKAFDLFGSLIQVDALGQQSGWAFGIVTVGLVRRLLFLVCGVVLIESVLFSALAPLLPHYERTLDLSKFEAGVLVGCYAAGAFLGALPSGFLGSRLGVKMIMLSGLGLLSCLSVVFGFASSIWLLDLARLGQGFGAALAWTGALAWLVRVAPQTRRGEVIGVFMAAAAAGTLVGPAVGAAATMIGTRPTFAAVALVGLALALWASGVPGPGRGEGQSLLLLVPALRRPGVAAGVWLLFLPSLMFGVLGLLGPLRLSDIGLSGSSIGAIFLVSAALEVVVSLFVGRWADRSGRRAPLQASLLASLVISFLFPLGTTEWGLSVLVVAAGTVYGAFLAPAMALLADEAEAAGLELVLAFALLNLAWAPGYLIGSTVGGALADATGENAPYLILALLSAGTLIALELIPRPPRQAQTQTPTNQ